jgi:hypothetical protein
MHCVLHTPTCISLLVKYLLNFVYLEPTLQSPLKCASNAESIPEHIAYDLGRLACPLVSCPSIQITNLMRAMARLFFCFMAEAGGEAQG